MKEVNGNLWDFNGHKVITTNGTVKSNGACVMGRGCAREAMIKYPRLPFDLGTKIKENGNHVSYFNAYDITSFPVKHNWWEKADLELIERSANELMKFTALFSIPFYLPRPGCGSGQLKWSDVKRVITPILSDQIYVVDF